MIRKIRLVNWKTHENTELEFDRGINLLVGIIGSGKTSVMDGICFGLFGTFPDLQNRRIKLDDVIMKKPAVKNKAEVYVEFVENGNVYSVKRVIERGKGSTYAEFRENGKLLEIQSSQRVTELVEKKLKMNYDLFSKIIYSKQNSIDYFLTIPRGKRMKQLDELLFIDKFEQARSSTVSLINRISDRIEEKETLLKRIDIKSLKAAANQLKLEIEKINSEKSTLENELGKISKDRVILEEKIKDQKLLKEEFIENSKKLDSIKALISELNSQISRIPSDVKERELVSIEKELNQIEKIYREAENVLNELRENELKTQAQFSKSLAELEATREKIERLESEVKSIRELKEKLIGIKSKYTEKELKEKEKELDETRTKLSKDEIELENVRKNILTLSQAESKCPVCEAKLTEKKKKTLIEKNEKRQKELEKEIEKLKSKVNEIKSSIEETKRWLEKIKELEIKTEGLEEKEKELETLKNMEKVFKDDVSSLEKKLKEIKEEIIKKEKAMKDLIKKKEELNNLLNYTKRYFELVEKLKVLESEEKMLSDSLKELEEKITQFDIETEEKELKELLMKERELATKISSYEELTKEKLERLKDLERNIQLAEKEMQEVKKLREILRDFKIFKSALEATQIDLRNEFVTVVNYYMNLIWSTLYPYKDFPSIRLAVEEKDYTLQLQERSGRWINVEGGVSGGERSLAALAMRVAFSLALAPQMKILILDEPTHNLDKKSVEELAFTLREKITEFMDQVFIITHDEKLEEAVTGRAYRLEREKEIDGVTKVSVIR